MPQATLVLTVFDKCLNIIGLVRDGKIKRDRQVDEALNALFKALCETKAYVAGLKRGERRDHHREDSIAFLWHKASVPLRYVDKELAHRCFFKGSFWHEPESWTEFQLRERRITLDQVCESAKQLLVEIEPNKPEVHDGL